MSSGLLKNIRFNMDDKEDRLLYEWLSRLPRGKFSIGTKEYWINKMKSEKDGD